jgi:hypothetical protein
MATKRATLGDYTAQKPQAAKPAPAPEAPPAKAKAAKKECIRQPNQTSSGVAHSSRSRLLHAEW